MQFSRYTHTFDLDDDIALYHSLRMKPVYISKTTYNLLNSWVLNSQHNDDIPQNLKKEIDELIKFKILNHSDDDDKILNFVKSKIPKPAINVCYFITSEQCNLACKYCFLGNNNKEKKRAIFAKKYVYTNCQ